VGQNECGADAGALLRGDRDGGGQGISTANFAWKTARTVGQKSLIVNGEPMRRNAMTEKSVLVTDERDFIVERQRLRESIDRFASGGPGICTKHPHFFFGPLTSVEWAVLMCQHLDHHLRQFGV
jgi:hypothetical protein